MSKTLLLVFTLLFSTAWLSAQTYPQTESSKTGTSSSEKTTVQGCLQGSEGNYTLTDNAGMTYRLEGDSSKLGAHVGHEVQISGTTTSSSSATSSTTSTTAGGAHETPLNVHSVKHISKTCKSAGK